MTKEEVLKKALDEIPEGIIFSGYDFSDKCKTAGIEKLYKSQSTIIDVRTDYLKKNCKRISRKMWIKKSKPIKKTIIQESIDFDIVNKERDIQFAITLLKANGYKIQKAITNYEEI